MLNISDVALYIANSYCIFQNCTSGGSSGAAYIISSTASILHCCFSYCISSSDQASQVTVSNWGTLQSSTIFECSPSSNPGLQYAFEFDTGNCTMSIVNSSYNYVTSQVSHIMTRYSSLSLSFCSFTYGHVNGNFAVAFHHCDEGGMISNMDIYDDTVGSGSILIYGGYGSILTFSNDFILPVTSDVVAFDYENKSEMCLNVFINCIFSFSLPSLTTYITVTQCAVNAKGSCFASLSYDAISYMQTVAFSDRSFDRNGIGAVALFSFLYLK